METARHLLVRWTPPGSHLTVWLLPLLSAAWTGLYPATADRVQPDITKTQFATKLSAAPVIDGVINVEEWQNANGASGNWRVSYDANATNGVRGGILIAGPDLADVADLGAQVYAGYDADNLYIALRITDSALFDDSVAAESANGKVEDDDSIELYIDPLNENAATYTPGSVGGRYAVSINNAYAGSDTAAYGTDKAWYARATRNDAGTGYDVEFRISLKSLSNPKLGDVMGFTFVVNDDKSGDVFDKGFDRRISWVGTPGKPVGYGNLILGYKAYPAPQVTAAPVIDGKINPAEYAAAKSIPINLATGQTQTAAGIDAWPAGTFEATAWVVHDTDAVYVAVDVIDTKVVTDTAEAGSEDGNTWEDDSVEIFFDADLNKNHGGPEQDFEGQYVLTANGAHRDNEARNPAFGPDADWFAATTLTDKGYQIEFKVKKTSLLNPTNGTIMGFNIALNNDNGTGRSAQLSWNGDPHQEYTYGELTLGPLAAAGPVKITDWTRNADGSFTLKWTGGGTLQVATDLNGTWTDRPTATSPYSFTPADKALFARIKL
jgi:hypothetical protein